jgi:hypothetical protein
MPCNDDDEDDDEFLSEGERKFPMKVHFESLALFTTKCIDLLYQDIAMY